jgi:hypothetical protein
MSHRFVRYLDLLRLAPPGASRHALLLPRLLVHVAPNESIVGKIKIKIKIKKGRGYRTFSGIYSVKH